MGGDADRRIGEAVALDDIAAFARNETVRGRTHIQRRLPIDDARIAAGGARFRLEQLEDFAVRRRRRGQRRRNVIAARRRPGQRAGIEERELRRRTRPSCGALERSLESLGRRVAGGGVTIAAIDIDRSHHATIGGGRVGQRNILPHGISRADFLDKAQRPEVRAYIEGRKRIVEWHGFK